MQATRWGLKGGRLKTEADEETLAEVFPSLDPDVRFRLTAPDYRYFRDVNEGIGVHVIGRRLST